MHGITLLTPDGGTIRGTKISRVEFTGEHASCLSTVEFRDKRLLFQNPAWRSALLGAGEEKAAYCVADHNGKLFALELIDEKHYLNGRLIGGEYFATVRSSRLAGSKFNNDSLIGLTFTGLVKAREYVHGYEWGRFQFAPGKKHPWDLWLTLRFQSRFRRQFSQWQSRYRDVHDRNVMFELLPRREKGPKVWIRDGENRLVRVSVGLRGIDLR